MIPSSREWPVWVLCDSCDRMQNVSVYECVWVLQRWPVWVLCDICDRMQNVSVCMSVYECSRDDQYECCVTVVTGCRMSVCMSVYECSREWPVWVLCDSCDRMQNVSVCMSVYECSREWPVWVLCDFQWDHAAGHGSDRGAVEQRHAVGQADGAALAASHQNTPLQQGDCLPAF